jgi:hypothetical protein
LCVRRLGAGCSGASQREQHDERRCTGADARRRSSAWLDVPRHTVS